MSETRTREHVIVDEAVTASTETMALVRMAAGLPETREWNDERLKAIWKYAAPAAKTIAQLAVFLGVAQKYRLDPMMREIWLADMDGKIQVVTGRDSYIKVASGTEGYEGFDSGLVLQKDEYTIERHGKEVTVHHIGKGTNRGDIALAYCVAYHKHRRPVVVERIPQQYAHLFNKTNWKNYKPDMLLTRVIMAALRLQHNITNLYEEGEFFDGEAPTSDEMEKATQTSSANLRERMREKQRATATVVPEPPAAPAAEETVVEAKDVEVIQEPAAAAVEQGELIDEGEHAK